MSGRKDSHLSLPRLFSDLPEREAELSFEFDGLAKTLAQLALNPDNPTPFTVVVRGGWGRGKTTLLPQAQRDHTLAIFLDDLDRCRPEKVREVLEAINLFLDLPGVCFFLGVDWRRLVCLVPAEDWKRWSLVPGSAF